MGIPTDHFTTHHYDHIRNRLKIVRNHLFDWMILGIFPMQNDVGSESANSRSPFSYPLLIHRYSQAVAALWHIGPREELKVGEIELATMSAPQLIDSAVKLNGLGR